MDDIAQKEALIQKMDDQIHEKKQFLLARRNALMNQKKNNAFLQHVKQDYEEYYNKLKEDKEKQVRHMQSLTDYVNRIIKEGGLTDGDMARAEWEQRQIMMEISKIKQQINELMQ